MSTYLPLTSTSSGTYVTIKYPYSTSTTSNIIISSSTSPNYFITTDYIDSSAISSVENNYKDICKHYGIDIDNKKVTAKHGWIVETPDGTIIEIDINGNIKIIDDNAKIVYKASRFREFNKYINASDLLEEFIRFSGSLGVRQSEVLNIPIELFINWLILKAAEQDGEPLNDMPQIEYQRKKIKRCLHCGRFIKNSTYEIAKFCNPQHYQYFIDHKK
jgi:hypothetical protein